MKEYRNLLHWNYYQANHTFLCIKVVIEFYIERMYSTSVKLKRVILFPCDIVLQRYIDVQTPRFCYLEKFTLFLQGKWCVHI